MPPSAAPVYKRQARRAPGEEGRRLPCPQAVRAVRHGRRRRTAGRTARRRRRVLLGVAAARGRTGLPAAGGLRGRRPGDRGPLPLPARPRRAGPAPDRRGPARAAVAGPRRPCDHPPGRHRHPVRGVGARRARGAGRRRLQLLGRDGLSDALTGLVGGLGAVRAGDRRGRGVQVRDHPPGRFAHPARRSAGPPYRGAARHRVHRARLAP